jgi:hypothetical protein
VRGVEEEQLTPMPENVIVNNNLFNQYQRQMIPNFQMGFGGEFQLQIFSDGIRGVFNKMRLPHLESYFLKKP